MIDIGASDWWLFQYLRDITSMQAHALAALDLAPSPLAGEGGERGRGGRVVL
jgi:hypothetical protein